MAFTWNPTPPTPSPDFSNDAYAIWKFRQKAGISQQDSTYEGALQDETIADILAGHKIEVGGTSYHQPLTALAFYIRSDPEQRVQSMEGDARDVWVDPLNRANALEREQELLNRVLIPGYGPSVIKPILTAWNRE